MANMHSNKLFTGLLVQDNKAYENNGLKICFTAKENVAKPYSRFPENFPKVRGQEGWR